MIQAAHPTQDPVWQRERAREVMTTAFEARRKLLGSLAVETPGPTFPHEPAERASLRKDFEAGQEATEVNWRAATGSTSSADRVEVAQVKGIICIRRGGNMNEAMFLTLPDWYIFAEYLGETSPARQLEDLQPEAPKVLDERLTKAKKQKLVDTVEDVLAIV
jgi:hypothetical protein